MDGDVRFGHRNTQLLLLLKYALSIEVMEPGIQISMTERKGDVNRGLNLNRLVIEQVRSVVGFLHAIQSSLLQLGRPANYRKLSHSALFRYSNP